MLVGTPWVLIIVFGLGLAAFLTLSIVFLVQKDQFKNEIDGARDKFKRIEQQWNTTSQNAKNFDAVAAAAKNAHFFPSEEHWSGFRLPRDIWPLSYELSIQVDIPIGEYSGTVIIQLKVLETTNRIMLHSKGQNITGVTLLNTCSNSVSFYIEHNLSKDFLIINADEYFKKNGIIQLTIDFRNLLQEDNQGFYATTYVTSNKVKKTLATTKFEPAMARKAFPCFDEPEMKATFDISIEYRNFDDYHAISNMNSLSVKNNSGWSTNKFAKSVLMSTYLVCFIVSDYAYKEARIDPKGIGEPFGLRVYASKEQLHLLELSLDAGKHVLEYYIQYFQIPFPLPKMAMISIPDFPSGATENWGLITYREEQLLYANKNTSSTKMKHAVASTIAHEYAHMWFGNLVTMKWWNDIWLNEGFASWFEVKALEAVYPKFRMREQFIVNVVQNNLKQDDNPTSRPVVSPVEKTDDFKDRFDPITYDKGASLVRMMEDFIGVENFQRASINYLNKHKYNNTETNDFLVELTNLNLDYDVFTIMRTWTEQMGFPVVHVEKLSDTKFNLTQNRFFKIPSDYDNTYDDSPFGYTWSIPITYLTSASSEVQRTWFHYNMKSVIIELPSTVDWIKFNINMTGFYRVNYEEDLWKAIINTLLQNPDNLSSGDRGSLLDDAFVLTEANQLSYNITLDLCKYLEKETEYVPWSSALSNLDILMNRIKGTAIFSEFERFIQNLIKNTYDEVGWSVGDDDLKNLLRAKILDTACKNGVEECLTEAAKQLDRFLENPDDPPHDDVRRAALIFGARKLTDTKKWEKLLDLYVSANDDVSKYDFKYGLGAVQDPALMSRLIDVAWNNSIVPSSKEYFSFLNAIAQSPIGNSVVWKYYRVNYPILVKRFGRKDTNLSGFVLQLSKNYNNQAQLNEIKEFFNKYPSAGGEADLRQSALRNVKNRIAWLENNLESIQNWLKSNA